MCSCYRRQQNYNWEEAQQEGMEDLYTRPAYDNDGSNEFVDLVQLSNRSSNGHAKMSRFENTLEVKVQEGDTLQALALRFHCTVADIKRLNKIDRENEIHAHRIIRIPVTVHNVLLGHSDADAFPAVHRSGNNSPRHNLEKESSSAIERNPLEDAQLMLNERLLVAAVNASGAVTSDAQPQINTSAIYKTTQKLPDDGGKFKNYISLLG